MASEHPTTFWQAIQDGNAFYKRQQVYSIGEKIPDLDDYIVAGCRYGGPVGKSHTTPVRMTNNVVTLFVKP